MTVQEQLSCKQNNTFVTQAGSCFWSCKVTSTSHSDSSYIIRVHDLLPDNAGGVRLSNNDKAGNLIGYGT